MQPPSPNCNYVEFIRGLVSYEADEGLVLTTPSKQDYNKLMMRCTNYYKNAKVFERQYKQFVHHNIFYNIVKATGEVTVYSLTPICRLDVMNISNILPMCFEKKKLSILNFTSTMNYDNIIEISKTIFRISNRIYVNFEEHTSCDGSTTYHAYVNYNHDKNVDWDTINQDLQKVIKIFDS